MSCSATARHPSGRGDRPWTCGRHRGRRGDRCGRYVTTQTAQDAAEPKQKERLQQTTKQRATLPETGAIVTESAAQRPGPRRDRADVRPARRGAPLTAGTHGAPDGRCAAPCPSGAQAPDRAGTSSVKPRGGGGASNGWRWPMRCTRQGTRSVVSWRSGDARGRLCLPAGRRRRSTIIESRQPAYAWRFGSFANVDGAGRRARHLVGDLPVLHTPMTASRPGPAARVSTPRRPPPVVVMTVPPLDYITTRRSSTCHAMPSWSRTASWWSASGGGRSLRRTTAPSRTVVPNGGMWPGSVRPNPKKSGRRAAASGLGRVTRPLIPGRCVNRAAARARHALISAGLGR